jgi:hypothetical protein
MAHLLLSLAFVALLGVGFRSIWQDLTRPLVMQPWDDEVMVALPAAAAVPASASVAVLRPIARPAQVAPVQSLPLAA